MCCRCSSFLFVCLCQWLIIYDCVSNKHISTVTCSLDLLAHVVDAAVQPVKDTDQAGNGFLAELHAVLEVQGELLLAAVLQCRQETLGIVTYWSKGRRCT